jgi:hypothetical protein
MALAAHRRGDTNPKGHPDAGDPTIDAVVGMLLEAQSMLAMAKVAGALKGMAGAG